MDHRELENLLRSRGSNGQCPLCSENNWVAVENDYEMAVAVIVDGEAKLPGLEVVGFACGRCGFLRLHSKVVLVGDPWGPKPPSDQ